MRVQTLELLLEHLVVSGKLSYVSVGEAVVVGVVDTVVVVEVMVEVEVVVVVVVAL